MASSGVLSNANRAGSDSSDKMTEAASAIREMQVTSASYTEQSRTRANRVKSTEIVPEFAPVREDSTGEKSDTDMHSAVNESVDPSSWSSTDLSGAQDIPDAMVVLPDRKVAKLRVAGRGDKQGGHGAIKTGSRTTAHVGFV